jgi:hypothetical protein
LASTNTLRRVASAFTKQEGFGTVFSFQHFNFISGAHAAAMHPLRRRCQGAAPIA